jgi:hypothetical protein
MPEQYDVVGAIRAEAGSLTDPRYSLIFTPETRCVVTELFAKWDVAVADEDLKAFLYGEDSRLGLPPCPNYQLFYGPGASSIAPLFSIFDLKNPRMRFTNRAFDPISTPIPLASPSNTFEIVLAGTPVTLKGKFGIEFSIRTRPFNS